MSRTGRPLARRVGYLAPVVLAAAVLRPEGTARGEGLSALVDPDYTNATTRTTDQAGHTTSEDLNVVTQRYRLTFDRTLLPLLRFDAGGTLERALGSQSVDGQATSADRTTTNLNAMLIAGGQVLNGSVLYNRHEDLQPSLIGPSDGLVNETIGLVAGWRPLGLPEFDLRLTRSNLFDTLDQTENVSTNGLVFGARYQPQQLKGLDLRYTLRVDDVNDHLHQTETLTVDNAVRGDFDSAFFGQRVAVHASVGLDVRTANTWVGAPGGMVATQQFPVGGLSLVEAFPATPLLDTLVANPALVDGDTATGAQVNLGYSVSLAGDTNPRDLGAQFADMVTRVNTIYVWVDRTLPPPVIAGFTWEVYRSDDNLNWVSVPLTGPVVFGVFQNRFELPFAETTSRYLKAVARPLSPAVTTDHKYADILVTEAQFMLVVPAATAVGSNWGVSENFNATARTQIFKDWHLYHELATYLSHSDSPLVTGGSATTWLLENALSFDQAFLQRVLRLDARVARQDLDQGRGHEGAFLYSASLGATPIRSLRGGFVFSGKAAQAPEGNSTSNSASLYANADVYTGVGMQAVVGYNLADSPAHVKTQIRQASITANVEPHRRVILSATYAYVGTHTSGGGTAESDVTSQRLAANASVSLASALFISAGASRLWPGGKPRNLANVGVNLSPFPGGELQARLSYSETLDTSIDGVSRLLTPEIRWNVRSGVFLDVAYSWLNTTAATGTTDSKTLTATLMVTL